MCDVLAPESSNENEVAEEGGDGDGSGTGGETPGNKATEECACWGLVAMGVTGIMSLNKIS